MRLGRLGVLAMVSLSAVSGARAAHSGERPYTLELGPVYMFTDSDDSEGSMVGGGLGFYFGRVEPGREPIAEAAFIRRIPNVTFMYGDSDMSIEIQEPGITAKMEAGGPFYSASLLLGESTFPLALTLAYAGTESDIEATADVVWAGPGTGTGEVESEELSGRLVFYVSRRTAFGLGYGRAESTMDMTLTFAGPPLVELPLKEEGETATYSVLFKHLAPVGNGCWLDVLGSVAFVDSEESDDDPATPDEEFENWEFEVTATIYPDRELGIVLGFGVNSGDDESDEGISASVGLTYNFGTLFGLDVDVEQFWADDEDEAEDTLTAMVLLVVRF